MNRIMLLVFILGAFSHAFAQEPDEQRSANTYGAFAHFNLNYHTADFSKLPGVPNCCPRFENGLGTGFTIGLLYERALSKSFFLSARLGWSDIGAELAETEPTVVICDAVPQDGEFEHIIDATLTNIGIEPLAGYRLFGGFHLMGGFRLGFAMDNDYSQVETITKPSDGATFLDSLGNDTGSRTRNDLSGELEDASGIYASLLLGAGYELPLNKSNTLKLVPEIFLSFGLTPVVSDITWSAHSLRAGVSIKYNPEYTPELIEEREIKEIRDTIEIESETIAAKTFVPGQPMSKFDTEIVGNRRIVTENVFTVDTIYIKKEYELAANVTLVGLDSAGHEIDNPVFHIEEFISTRLQPLLNYVFFEQNSGEIPGRYEFISSGKTRDFVINDLFDYGTIETYYHLLNIVGKRMGKYPEAKLRIIGCNNAIDEEAGNRQLSRMRAEKVREYLTKVWNIDESRIGIEVRDLPDKPSSPTDERDKLQENRRVELYSDTYEILAPLIMTDTFRVASPPVARFHPNVRCEAGLEILKLKAKQQSDQSRQFDTSVTGMVPDHIDWQLANNQKIVPRYNEAIDYSINVRDKKGKEMTSDEKTLPVDVVSVTKKREQQIADMIIDKYSLILFDFDKYDISGTNRRIVDYIRGKIESESRVKILGYTDRSGEYDYNRNLSLSRARVARNALGLQPQELKGIGRDKLLYNNDLPEGRFYCRTVEIIVETPITY